LPYFLSHCFMMPKQMASVSTGKVPRLVCRTTVLGYEVRRVVTVLYRETADRVGSEAERCNILCYRYHDIMILCHVMLQIWHDIVPLCYTYNDITIFC
jgi:hypothetical protein